MVKMSTGETGYWENTANPIKNNKGEIVACLEIARDITKQKEMESLLRQSEQKWEDIFDPLTDAITVHDTNFNIVSSNKAAKEMLGIALPVVKKKNIKCFKHYHGTDKPPAGCPSCECLKTGKPTVSEFFEPHLNRYIEIRTIPRLDSHDKLIGLIQIARDITKRKKVEQELVQSKEDLVTQTNSLNESNTALKVLLGQREKDKTELEEKVLLNIKTSVLPYIEKLKQNNGAPEHLKYINILESNLNDIISSFALKASSAHFNLTPKEIQVSHLIREGRQSKEIADILDISFETVNCHRQSIRKKFDLNNKSNLRSYLLSLSE